MIPNRAPGMNFDLGETADMPPLFAVVVEMRLT